MTSGGLLCCGANVERELEIQCRCSEGLLQDERELEMEGWTKSNDDRNG
eukprot:CAMPEP_0201876626 /NCGR_PEP_ID=MMETSP0902-20130614/8264_1 /ASSEMBLY_ACC=CAM_ASM_000551 /TAXON_ID=420261 /ORGANISM="Thalassiosira antarctica, Strain CCMP982" /LENGTH=48 /DNA_ID= /DNA_START= /DNA_END= /DNA_ORIENTATION=